MRDLRLVFPFALAIGAVGCGGNNDNFSAGGVTVNAQDEGYYYTTGDDFCAGGAIGQMELRWVDYPNLCNPKAPPDVNPAVQHTEFRIVLNVGTAPSWAGHYPPMKNDPYVISAGDCENPEVGANPSVAEMITTPPMGSPAVAPVYADSGTVQITGFEPDGSAPLTGTMDLKFGSTTIKKNFKLYSCN